MHLFYRVCVLVVPRFMCVYSVTQLRPALCTMDCNPQDSSVRGILKNTEAGNHLLLKGILPSQESNFSLLQVDSLPLSY